ncbi:ImuA family protein [Flexibacterium corallicola]|uniref:ImuA family protein n=1 Tax=Flexibacterium corallicola TaxID=3037259 RepID=UPI00286F4C89|nr:inducible mutagenesis protein A [Pseudovibrio sp. M1P-2-3]
MKPNRHRIEELRKRIAGLEGRLPSSFQSAPALASATNRREPGKECDPDKGELVSGQLVERLKFHVQTLDSFFPEAGMKLSALHEIYGTETRLSGGVIGFVSGLLAGILRNKSGPVLWVSEERSLREIGSPYPSGLCSFGIDPARVIFVRARRVEEALWVMEEGGQCPSLAGVLGEFRGDHAALGLTATRRLSLRSEQACLPFLLVRYGGTPMPTAALTRWRIEPMPSERAASLENIIGRPRWLAYLERNREGRMGRCALEWNYEQSCFRTASENTVPMAQGVGNRQNLPSGSGEVVALQHIDKSTRRLRKP